MFKNTFEFQDFAFTPDTIHEYDADTFQNRCIVIDNGSHTCRAGWSHESAPKLTFRNLHAKLRSKKDNEVNNTEFFGNDIEGLEDLKWTIRTQFDANVVTHFDIQEHAFDYLFKHLGLNGEAGIEHPVCMTEAVCVPNTLRNYMSEILFECYNVPRLAYGIDALFSLHQNRPHVRDGIVISCGYQATHVLPIVNGVCDTANARRLNVGGLNMMIFSRRLLQLQYPHQAAAINLSRTQELLAKHCYFALDYADELKKWQNKDYKEANALNLQLPVLNLTTEKDLEQRKLQARRLKDVNQKKREEKLKAEQEQVSKLKSLRDNEPHHHPAFKAKLKEMNMKTEADLSNFIKELEEKIADRKAKSAKYFEELYQNRDSINVTDDTSIEEVEKVLEDLEEEKLSLFDKRRSRATKKQALNKRKSFASKERMRVISQLAKGGPNSTDKANKEDTFGMKDEDWEVYKFINKDGSDSEDESNQERLNEVEQLIANYQLELSKLMIGRGVKYQYLSFDVHQHRVPEILFQPSMVGVNQEGLAGMLSYVLRNYDPSTQDRMIKNIFLTGCPSMLPGFKQRLETELMALLPFQSVFNVSMADDAFADGWLGARSMVNNPDFSDQLFLDRNGYQENGPGFVKEHKCSNKFVRLK